MRGRNELREQYITHPYDITSNLWAEIGMREIITEVEMF